MSHVIPTAVVPSVEPSPLPPRRIAAELRALVADGAEMRPAGEARDDPWQLFSRGYAPRHRIDLFDTRIYLTRARQNPAVRFFVAYVVQKHGRRGRIRVSPRILYKDVSLIWRAASHMIATEREFWIGKGDVTRTVIDGHEHVHSLESTTDLPLELQNALEQLNGQDPRVPTDHLALYLVLRAGPDHRVAPYRDFSEPRRIAMSQPRNRIHGGRRIARFARRNDPTSLRFAKGFEPDLADGLVEVHRSRSKLYGGELRRCRILSTNRRIQYLFIAAPRHVWIVPPQATTTELSSYCVRTVDVHADEDLFVPGFEYHYWDDEAAPPCQFSQIPDGYAGEPHAGDPSRADASRWLDKIPVIRDFRRRVLTRLS